MVNEKDIWNVLGILILELNRGWNLMEKGNYFGIESLLREF